LGTKRAQEAGEPARSEGGAAPGAPEAVPGGAAGGGAGWVLPDYLRPGLRLVVVGFNPGLTSAARGHYYAHPTNRLWDLLFDAGLLPTRLRCEDDSLAPDLGVGFTDVVKRSSASAGDLGGAELRAGVTALRQRLLRCPPRVVCWGGKGVYRAFAAVPAGRPVSYGRQPAAAIPGVVDFVAPSPSGRSGLPYSEKLHWYRELARVVAES
jgi:TDG/mug DNA glycosylase family protein